MPVTACHAAPRRFLEAIPNSAKALVLHNHPPTQPKRSSKMADAADHAAVPDESESLLEISPILPGLGLCSSCQAITLDKLHLHTEYAGRPGYAYGPRVRDLPARSLVCRFCRLVYFLCEDYVQNANLQRQNCEVELLATTSQGRDFRTEVLRGQFGAGAGTGGALSGFLIRFRGVKEAKDTPDLVHFPRELRVFVRPDSPPELRRQIAGRAIASPNSELSYGKIERWIQICLQTHVDCRRTISGVKVNDRASGLPRRVIDLGLSPEKVTPKLLETKKTQRGRYVALSYCWGGTSPVKTTRDTYAALKRDGVPLEKLPRTIQDAIAVTRRLGVRYLWVDSLCIVQDDTEDWLRESVNMGRIYQLAFLTIAATGAHESSEGCFLPRGLDEAQSPAESLLKTCITLPCLVGGTNLGDMYVGLPAGFPNKDASHAFSHELRSGRWYRRGWVLQERLLSRRIVHFGKHQIFWECNEGMIPETGQSSVSNHDPESLWKGQSLVGVRADVGLDPPVEIFHKHKLMRRLAVKMWHLKIPGRIRLAINGPFSSVHWRTSVEKYSECRLTFENDKLPAIEGMAKEIGRRTGRKYCAGLWIEDIGRGLFWGADTKPLERPEVPRAPTWSWAAWNGKITSPARFNTLTHAIPKRARFLAQDTAVKTIPGAKFEALRLSTHMWNGRRTQRPVSEYPDVWKMRLSVEGVIWAISQEAIRSRWSALVEPGGEGENCVGLIQLDDPETAPLDFGCAVLGGYHIASAQESAFECKPGWYRYCFLAVEETSSGVYKRLGIGITAPRDGHKDWERKTLTLI